MQMQQISSRPAPKQSPVSISLPKAPSKRPRSPPPPLFQQDDENSDTDDETTFSQRDAHSSQKIRDLTALTRHPVIHSAANDLSLTSARMRYHRPLKSRRFPQRRPRSTLPAYSLIPSEAKSRPNSSHSAQHHPSHPVTIWQKLADASDDIHNQPRLDSRFASGQRPLDRLSDLRASIAITLFPDGYVRHDWTLSPETVSPESPGPVLSSGLAASQKSSSSISALRRLPYDRNSKEFLRCLDLGVIPHPEDLPDENHCFYYDGCLIAEIADLRAPLFKHEGPTRFLLRPHMASLYDDLEQVREEVNPEVALLVEQKIIALTTPNINVHPYPLSSLHSTDRRSTVHAMNVIRAPKRRRIERKQIVTSNTADQCDESAKMAAWLLITAADKQQKMCQYAAYNLRLSEHDSASGSQRATNNPVATKNMINTASPRASVVATGKNTVLKVSPKSKSTALSQPAKSKVKNIGLPPPEILNVSPKSGNRNEDSKNVSNNSERLAKSAGPARQLGVPTRLRQLQMIQPVDSLKPSVQAVQTAIRNGCAKPRELEAVRESVMANVNRAGRLITLAELNHHMDDSYDIMFTNCVYAEKNRDHFRVPLNNEEEGHAFLTQFRKLSENEGNFCHFDRSNPNFDVLVHQQRLQQMQQNQQQQQFLQKQQQQSQQPLQSQPLQSQQPQQPQTQQPQQSQTQHQQPLLQQQQQQRQQQHLQQTQQQHKQQHEHPLLQQQHQQPHQQQPLNHQRLQLQHEQQQGQQQQHIHQKQQQQPYHQPILQSAQPVTEQQLNPAFQLHQEALQKTKFQQSRPEELFQSSRQSQQNNSNPLQQQQPVHQSSHRLRTPPPAPSREQSLQNTPSQSRISLGQRQTPSQSLAGHAHKSPAQQNSSPHSQSRQQRSGPAQKSPQMPYRPQAPILQIEEQVRLNVQRNASIQQQRQLVQSSFAQAQAQHPGQLQNDSRATAIHPGVLGQLVATDPTGSKMHTRVGPHESQALGLSNALQSQGTNQQKGGQPLQNAKGMMNLGRKIAHQHTQQQQQHRRQALGLESINNQTFVQHFQSKAVTGGLNRGAAPRPQEQDLFRQEFVRQHLQQQIQQQLQRRNKGTNNGNSNNGHGANGNVLLNGANAGHEINLQGSVSNGLVGGAVLNTNVQLDRVANGLVANPNAVIGTMNSMGNLGILGNSTGSVSLGNGATINAFNQQAMLARFQQHQHQNPGLQNANQNILNGAAGSGGIAGVSSGGGMQYASRNITPAGLNTMTLQQQQAFAAVMRSMNDPDTGGSHNMADCNGLNTNTDNGGSTGIASTDPLNHARFSAQFETRENVGSSHGRQL